MLLSILDWFSGITAKQEEILIDICIESPSLPADLGSLDEEFLKNNQEYLVIYIYIYSCGYLNLH